MTVNLSDIGSLWMAPLIPLCPLVAAALIGIVGLRWLKGASHWLTIGGIALSCVFSYLLFGAVRQLPHEAYDHTYRIFTWIVPNAAFNFDVSFRIDPLTAIMLTMVCTIATLIAIYSRDYMRVPAEEGHGHGHGHEHGHGHDHGHGHPTLVPERGYERFFAWIALFVFSMCMLVLAGNFLLLYLGWEAVGLCSYLLIGFYYQRPSAALAARKAFLVNRVGDFGFGLGILFIYLWLSPYARPGENPLDYGFVFANIHHLTSGQADVIALLLFCGAVGKSAQIPLYVWLPDAMEGPSPVSALIHAATMVTAGVYMVVRCGAVFTAGEWALPVVAGIGAASSLFAATMALAQYDMKRILAYSTMSQLGYMFLGAGVLAADSAIFHLYTHAFFKALLFLGAGSVMHAMGNIIDLREFSGLRRIMPITFATFVIGSLALAGIPPLAGFFSKDEIIHAAFNRHVILGLIGLVTAVLTAFYTFRMVFLAFMGPEKTPPGAHAHESTAWMTIPLVLLSVGAIFAGYLGVRIAPGHGFLGFIEPHGAFHHFLEPVVQPFKVALADPHAGGAAAHAEHESPVLMYVSALLAIAGIAAAWFLYVMRRDLPEKIRESQRQIFTVLHNKYYVDEMYEAGIVRPLRGSGVFFFGLDRFVIDGLVWLVTAVPRTIGFVLRGLQNGAIQSYGVSMTAGMIIIVLIVWLSR